MSIYSKLESIYESINDLIEEEEATWYTNRKLPHTQLSDLEEVRDLLGQIINDEPTDQQMMASFGTKWHDKL